MHQCSGKVSRGSSYDYIIIDEISMVSERFYNFFIVLKRLNPDVKFIIAGDFNQLLPVNDRVGDCDYKNSSALHELVNGNRLQLSNCRRSDRLLFDMLNPKTIMNLKKEQFGSDCNTELHLSFTNKTRKEINHEVMEKVIKQKKKKYLELKSLPYDGNSQNVKLIAGTPVIARMNNREHDVVNNQTFVITKVNFSNSTIELTDEGEDLIINFDEFSRLFYVAYCLTIHKCQGCTFKEKYCIHEFDKLDKRLRYVALSRSSDIKHINIA
jgi:ATP-dependent exoDNAse (exonuclease V) alpha subunit